MPGLRNLSFLSALIVALCHIIPSTYAAASKKPHLFFILVDDLGFNDFSYRSSDLKDKAWTNVNGLLEESVKIDHYYTQQLCTPSRAAFMSGRYPARLGLQHQVIAGFQDYGLPLDEVTIADKLKAAGYATHAVGKWHLGCYNFESTPTYRGFDTYFGYYNGAEDYETHVIQNYLDFHRQWNSTADSPTGKAYEQVSTENGVYSTGLFASEMTASILNHKAKHDDKPGFFYLPLQNVHEPLESPGPKYDAMCEGIPNSDRKTFCAMAAVADEAIGNLTTLIKEQFEGEEYLVVISGDNGGMPMSAGNNFPLRGHKAELWEGGVRNNAVVWGSALPTTLRGSTFDGGLVHITDWHATFAKLGGASLEGKPLDGKDIWGALTSESVSPRTEFLINHDPCSGHGSCAGVEWAYRSGDLKLAYGVAEDTWYPLPTSDEKTDELQKSTATPGEAGSVIFGDEHYASTRTNKSSYGLRPPCVAAVEKACPAGTILCSQCISDHWSDISKYCSVAPEARVSGIMCYGVTAYLFNITADPYEQYNLLINETSAAQYTDVVATLSAKVDAIVKGDDYKAPCNIPGGTCYNTDYNGYYVANAHGGWYPWVNTTSNR